MFDEARVMWNQTFAPHYPKQHVHVFIDDFNAAETAYHEKKFAEAINPVAKWHSWALVKTYTADVSGPALAFFDMEELLKKLKNALLAASNNGTIEN